ncbi:MAG: ABC transporter ATP-binding protein [Thermoprotei archaeon]
MAERLSKLYGSFQAVRNVSFRVRSGTAFGLIGPNGAGKTTVLRMVSGLIKPTDGSVKVLGRDPASKEARTRMSILPEEAGVYEKLTVYESIYYYGLLRGLGPAAAKSGAEKLIAELGLQDKHDEMGSRLSKGLKRKTLLAMCLVNNPDLLVLDEPTDGLDLRSATSVRSKLIELVSKGKTLVITSHNLREIADVAQEIAVIDRGTIVASGSPSQILSASGYRSLEEFFLTVTHEDEEQ